MEHPLYQPAPDSMRVIETLGYHRDEGCRHLDLHLARLQRSAQALEFRIDLTAIRTRLQSIKKRSATPLSAYRGATQPSGKIVTPALSCGVLPGVFRQTLLTKGLCTEQVITRQDLAQCRAISVGNSLRGGIGAVLCDVKA